MEIDLSQPGLDTQNLKKSINGVNITPFIWDVNGSTFNMNFISGFAGTTITDEKFVKAELSWAVAEKKEAPKKKAPLSKVK